MSRNTTMSGASVVARSKTIGSVAKVKKKAIFAPNIARCTDIRLRSAPTSIIAGTIPIKVSHHRTVWSVIIVETGGGGFFHLPFLYPPLIAITVFR